MMIHSFRRLHLVLAALIAVAVLTFAGGSPAKAYIPADVSPSTRGSTSPLPATALAIPATSSAGDVKAGTIEVAQRRRGFRRYRGARSRGVRGRRAARFRGARARHFRNRRVVRRGYRRGGRRYYRRHGRYYRPYYRPYYYYDGGAVAAGVIGLAAGAVVGGALAYREPEVVVVDEPRYAGVPAPFTGAWYRQCARKYRSFRASDGTYLTYRGVRRRCRLP